MMSTHPDPRARARPIFRRWALVGTAAVLAAGAVVLLLLQVMPDVRTDAPAAAPVPRGPRTSGRRAPGEVATEHGPKLGGKRQREDVDRPDPRDSSSEDPKLTAVKLGQDLRRLFVTPHLRPEDLARVREIAATETDPERSALAAAILSKSGDQEAIERLVRIAAKNPKTIASYLLFELEPDRALALLRLAQWGDAAGADRASKALATLLRRAADGEEALGAALRDAAPDQLPRWMDVVAGYRIIPRAVAVVLVGFLANGTAVQRAGLSSFLLERPEALREVAVVVAPQISDLAESATEADVGTLLRFTDLAADAGRDVGRGLLTLHLRSRAQDGLGDGMRAAVARWMAERYPDVATMTPERSQSMRTALEGPDAASILLAVLRSEDRNEILFACRRVLRGGAYDAAPFARPLLEWAYRADKEVAAAAVSALEGLRKWPPELARSAARDLLRLVDDKRELVSLRAAHALPSLPDAEETIGEYLGRVSEAPEDGPVISALLDGLLDQPRLLADQTINEHVMSLFRNERAKVALPVRRRIIAWVADRDDGQVSAEEGEAARSVFPLRSRAACADWMADAAIRKCALAILNRLEIPTVADGVAVRWATRDPQVASRAQDILRRPEWIAAAERMSRADAQTFNELVW